MSDNSEYWENSDNSDKYWKLSKNSELRENFENSARIGRARRVHALSTPFLPQSNFQNIQNCLKILNFQKIKNK